MIYELKNTDSGLTHIALCDSFGWSYREVAKTAKYLGMATHDYLQAKTGWLLRLEYYYPRELGLYLLNQDLLIRQSRRR
jgi:hypothetical protein